MSTFQEIVFDLVLDFYDFHQGILFNKTAVSIELDPAIESQFEGPGVAHLVMLIMTVSMTACISFFAVDGLKEQKEKPKKPDQLPIFLKLFLYLPYIYLVFILYRIGLYIVHKIFSPEYMLPSVDIPMICIDVIVLNRLVNRIIDHKWIKKPQSELLTSQVKQQDLQSETVPGCHHQISEFISIIISSSIGFWYLYEKHWIPSNVLIVAMAYGFIECFSITWFGLVVGYTLTIFYSLLDVYWIFFTDTYTKKPQTHDALQELIVPQDLFENGFNGKQYFILRFEHIVIPGLLIAHLLRGDHFDGQSKNDVSLKKRNYTYFCTSLIAYFIGLALSLYIMIVFNHSQPTFLYILPTIALPISLAILKGYLRISFDLKDFEKYELIEIEFSYFPFFFGAPIYIWMISIIYSIVFAMIVLYKKVYFSSIFQEICKNQVA